MLYLSSAHSARYVLLASFCYCSSNVLCITTVRLTVTHLQMGMKVGNDDSTTRTRILALDFLQVDFGYICECLYTALFHCDNSM